MALQDDIQKLYIAYFGRPADPAGLAFYVQEVTEKFGGNFAAVAGTFSSSQEYRDLYNFNTFTNEGRRAAVLEVYRNLLNRSEANVDAEGLQFYMDRLAADPANGLSTLVLDVLGGAQNEDRILIQRKIDAAKLFTAALDTPAEIGAYSTISAVQIARDYLTVVTSNTSDSALTTNLNQTIDRLLQSDRLAPSADTRLTTFIDSVVGTQQNDFFFADLVFNNGVVSNQTTLQPDDTIDGQAGQDTLVINVSGNRLPTNYTQQLNLNRVESVVVNNRETDPANNVTFTTQGSAPDLQSIEILGERLAPGFNSTTTFTGLNRLVDVAFTIQDPTLNSQPSTPELESTVNQSTRKLVLRFDPAVTASNADAMQLTIQGVNTVPAVGPRDNTPRLANFELDVRDVEQLFITSDTQPGLSGATVPLIRSVKFSEGSDFRSIDLIANNSTQNPGGLKIDASFLGATFTRFDATQQSSPLVLDIGSTLSSAQTLRGSITGTNDMLAMRNPSTLTAQSSLSIQNFEFLRMYSNSLNTFDVSNIRGVNTYELRAINFGDNLSVKGVRYNDNPNATEVFITADSIKVGGITATVEGAANPRADQVLDVAVVTDLASLTVKNAPNLALNTREMGQIAFRDYKDPVLNDLRIQELRLDGVRNLSFDEVLTPATGIAPAELRTLSLNKVVVVDDGALTITARPNTTLKMGTFTDTSGTTTINGSNGSDIIFGSVEGVDIINAGGGNNLVNITDGAQTVRDVIRLDTSALGLVSTTVEGFQARVSPSTNLFLNNFEDRLEFSQSLLVGNTNFTEFVAPTEGSAGFFGFGGSTGTPEDSRLKRMETSAATVDNNDLVVITSTAVLGVSNTNASTIAAAFFNRVNAGTVPDVNQTDRSFIALVSDAGDTFVYRVVVTLDRGANPDVVESTSADLLAKLVGAADTGTFGVQNFGFFI